MKNKNEHTIFSNELTWQRVSVEFLAFLFIQFGLIFGGTYIFPSLAVTSESKFWFSIVIVIVCFTVGFILFFCSKISQAVYTYSFEAIMAVGIYAAFDRFGIASNFTDFTFGAATISFSAAFLISLLMLAIYIPVYFGSLALKEKYVSKI
jgi:hypothetical protein